MALLPGFFLGGFEGSSHRRADGHQLDLIAATRHDAFARADYALLRAAGIRAARDALRWHRIEVAPGRWDWSSFLPMLRAAREAGVRVIWDLCHYGLPDGLDLLAPQFPDRFAAFAAAAARVVRAESDAPPFWCAVNEISYWAWAGGEHGLMAPHAAGQGPAVKRQLVRAAVAATRAVRDVDPRARLITAEPAINVVALDAQHAEAAETYRQAQFEAYDLLAGRREPELGGTEDCLDIVGANFYFDNQWLIGGPTIGMGHRLYRPFADLLAELHARYGRSILVTETGAEGPGGPGWLRYVGGEVRAARRAGVPVEGICLYPIMDYPGWLNERHCRCGVIACSPDWDEHRLDPAMLAEIGTERRLFTAASRSGPHRARAAQHLRERVLPASLGRD